MEVRHFVFTLKISSQTIKRRKLRINIEQNPVKCVCVFYLLDKLTIVHHPSGKCLLFIGGFKTKIKHIVKLFNIN